MQGFLLMFIQFVDISIVKTGFPKINMLGADNSMKLQRLSKKGEKITTKSVC